LSLERVGILTDGARFSCQVEDDEPPQGGMHQHQEGALTMLRSAVVNNTRLAAAALALQLHTMLKMDGSC
jgi:hypothetical protein